jgi:hypothetical protein
MSTESIFSAEHLFHPAALTAIVGGAMSWQAQNFSHGLRTDYRKSLGFCNWIQSFATFFPPPLPVVPRRCSACESWNAFGLVGYEHVHDNLLKRNWDREYCCCCCCCWQFLCLVKYIFPKHAHCSRNHHDSETSLLLLRLPQSKHDQVPAGFPEQNERWSAQARTPGTKVL